MLLLLFWPTSVKLINSKFLLVLSLVVYIIYKFINLFTDRFTISLGYKLLSGEQALILHQRLRAKRTIDRKGLTFSFSLLDTWLLFHRGRQAKIFVWAISAAHDRRIYKAIYAGADSCLAGLRLHFTLFKAPPSFPPPTLPFPLTFLFLPLPFPPFPSFSFRSRLLKCS